MKQIRHCWECWNRWIHAHEKAVSHINHGTHLTYFAMIVLHGPYHIAAGGLLVVGLITWITALD